MEHSYSCVIRKISSIYIALENLQPVISETYCLTQSLIANYLIDITEKCAACVSYALNVLQDLGYFVNKFLFSS